MGKIDHDLDVLADCVQKIYTSVGGIGSENPAVVADSVVVILGAISRMAVTVKRIAGLRDGSNAWENYTKA